MVWKQIGFAWKILPSWTRLRIIRVTQQKFTVSAAAVIVDAEGKVLLLNHLLRPFSGWGLPGGFITAAEQPEDAIRREIREETGLELTNVRMFRIRTVARHIEMLFLADPAGEASVQSREILGLGWFDPNDLPEKLSNGQKKVIREVVSGER